MTQYTYRGIVQLLAENFSNARDTWNTVYAVAICFAESGGNTEAISPGNARGLWQIIPSNFPGTHLTFSTWDQPVPNARAMMIMSGGMQNWAPWSSAWQNEGAADYTGHLGAPQAGSAAATRVDEARAAVTQYFLNPPTGPSGPALTPQQQDEAAVNNGINAIRDYFRTEFPAQIKRTVMYGLWIDRSF